MAQASELDKDIVGHHARMPHKRAVIITTSLLIAAVPSSAFAYTYLQNGNAVVVTRSNALTQDGDSTPAPPPEPPATPEAPIAANPKDSTSTQSSSVMVNGQTVAIPDNGTTTQSIDSPNGSTSVEVTNNSASTSQNSHSSLRVEVQTSSSEASRSTTTISTTSD